LILLQDAPTPGVSDMVTVVFSCPIPSTGFICRLGCMYVKKGWLRQHWVSGNDERTPRVELYTHQYVPIHESNCLHQNVNM